jgi:MFS family permease
MNPVADAPRATSREWVGLAVLALPCALYAMDLTVLHLAVPQLSKELAPSATELLWIIDVYGFLVAGSLITMGTLGDRIGRRRMLLLGAGAFAVASVLAAFSTSAAMLIATRALLGIAGATVAPSTMSLIRNMFRDPREFTTAVGVWIASYSAGAAIGPVVGGVLLECFWSGSVFLLAVPIMGLVLVLGPILLPEYRDPAAGRPDLPSTALAIGGVLAVVYGLKQVAVQGIEPLALVSVVAGVALGALFVRRQRRLADPLIDLSLFANRTFSGGLALYTSSVLAVFGAFLFVPQYLQLVRDLSPLEAGLWSLPWALAAARRAARRAPPARPPARRRRGQAALRRRDRQGAFEATELEDVRHRRGVPGLRAGERALGVIRAAADRPRRGWPHGSRRPQPPARLVVGGSAPLRRRGPPDRHAPEPFERQRRAGQRLGGVRAGAQAVDRELEVAVGERVVERAREGPGQRPGQAGQGQADVGERRVGAQGPRHPGALDQPLHQLGRGLARAHDRLVVQGDGAEQRRDDRADAQVEGAVHVARQRPEGVRLLVERQPRLLRHAAEQVVHDRAHQRPAVGEPAVQRADADAGARGDLLERRPGPLLDEEVARRQQDPLAVAPRVGAHGRRRHIWGHFLHL